MDIPTKARSTGLYIIYSRLIHFFNMIPYPEIDPVIFEIGPLAIRWYSVSYVLGILVGCYYMDWLNKTPPSEKKLKIFDDFMVWAIIGIIFGGRIGYILFYNFSHYLSNPLSILQVWQGGMSFHGGFLGVIAAIILFCRKYKINSWMLFDLAACAAPIGLFFGRLANFINGELYGRATDVSWAMIFPNAGNIPRHPSQLYEAALEGVILFTILFYLAKYKQARKTEGLLSGIFLFGYATSRIIVEFFREPDSHIGFLFANVTTGQLLSLPMLALGGYLILRKNKN